MTGSSGGRTRGRVDTFEWLALAALGAFSIVPLLVLWHRAKSGQTWTGADGLFVGDQLQYFSWIRDAADHVLASNLFAITPSPHVFLHPMFSPSGALVALGVPIPASYLLWKPVAVVMLGGGVALYVRRLVGNGARGALALTLALGAWAPLSFLMNIAALGDDGQREKLETLAGTLFPAGYLWGYLPIAIAVGLMPIFFLQLERALRATARSVARPSRSPFALTIVTGVLVSWLHPWQGETLLLVVLALAAVRWRRARERWVFATAAVAVAVPILGYYLLSRWDPAWALAARQNEAPIDPLWMVLLLVGPLGAVAAWGARFGARKDVQEVIVRLWPPATLVVYLLLSPSVPFHALEGLTVPLAVLAVRALPTGSRAWPAYAAAFLLVAYGAIHSAQDLRKMMSAGTQPYFVTASERRSLAYLRSSAVVGGVVSRSYLGTAVPEYTGRTSWVGHPSWTPDFFARQKQAKRLFAGDMSPDAARAFVRRTGATFVLKDCETSPDLQAILGLPPKQVVRFGCASLARIR